MENIIVCDLGGTYSRFATFTKGQDHEIAFAKEIWEETNSHHSFGQLLAALKGKDPSYDAANQHVWVVAVPGPVTPDDRLGFPNVKWQISKAEIGKLYPDTSFTFINDFIAQAFGCLTKAAADATPIIARKTPRQGREDLAIVGAGTGTGHGALKVFGDNYIPFPSEAGHAHFPFITKGELEFRDFLNAENGHPYPVCDDVVSGPGLARLHQFLTGRNLSPKAVARELTPESPTTQWFSRFYARVCRNFCLTALATGGRLFVSGGVAIKNPFLVDNDIFRNEFLDCSSNISRLNHISVSLIRNEKIGLYGAAYYACNTR
jgi:glucokinase